VLFVEILSFIREWKKLKVFLIQKIMAASNISSLFLFSLVSTISFRHSTFVFLVGCLFLWRGTILANLRRSAQHHHLGDGFKGLGGKSPIYRFCCKEAKQPSVSFSIFLFFSTVSWSQLPPRTLPKYPLLYLIHKSL